LEEIITEFSSKPNWAIRGMAYACLRPVAMTISMPAASAARIAAQLRGLILGPVDGTRVPSISIAIN
jgi:hypothetical protein